MIICLFYKLISDKIVLYSAVEENTAYLQIKLRHNLRFPLIQDKERDIDLNSKI